MKAAANFVPAGRGALGLSLMLLGGLTFVGVVTRPPTPIDETRYLSVAWEMWLRGDFLVPFKGGAPYSDKPPLMFWIMQAGWALLGVNDWWPRLVSPLFSAGSLLLTYRLARRLWPSLEGLGGQAALVLAGALLWTVASTTVMFDAMLAFWVLFGVHGILDASDGNRRGFVLLGIACGLGALTKGPVILLHLLPVAVLAPWWSTGLRRSRWFAGTLLAVLLGAVITLSWALPAGRAGGEAYRNAILWGQTANRVVASFAHRRPFWWYVPLLPLILFPWLAWPGWWKALIQRRPLGWDRGLRFCLAWMGPVFVGFCFVSGKQVHYLVPLFPPFALLTARMLAEAAEARVGLPALVGGTVGGAIILAGSGWIPGLENRLVALPPMWPGAVLIALALVVWVAGRRGAAPVRNLALLGAALPAMVEAAGMHSVSPIYDLKPMALAIRQVQDEARPVANIGAYHAQYQFLGRLNSPVEELSGAGVMSWLATHPQGYVVIYLKDRRNLDGVDARYQQDYPGGIVALVDAATAAKLLAAPFR